MGRTRLYSDKERRARALLKNYNAKDAEYNRGIGDLTPEWIVDNILSKPCAHCGETDWTKIGCNRLDNTKPHTMDNVEPCCKKHNDELSAKEKKINFGKLLDQIDKITGEVLTSFQSVREAVRLTNFSKTPILYAANGGYSRKGKWINTTQAYGSVWKYHK